MNTFDDKPIVIPQPRDLFADAPTLDFSNGKPIYLEDLKRAIERGKTPRPLVGWEAKPLA